MSCSESERVHAYQKLSRPTISKVSRAQRRDVQDQTSSGEQRGQTSTNSGARRYRASLTQLAQFVAWLRRTRSPDGKSRSDSTINTILAAVGFHKHFLISVKERTAVLPSYRVEGIAAEPSMRNQISCSQHLNCPADQSKAFHRPPLSQYSIDSVTHI